MEHKRDVMATALRHALTRAASMDAVADDLVRAALGSAAIEDALARVDRAFATQPSDVADYARRALERALALARRAEERVEEATLLRTILDATPAMLAYWDSNLRNVSANAAYEHWFGFSPEDMRRLHMSEVLGEEVFAGNLRFIEGVMSGTTQRFTRHLTDVRGASHPVLATYTPDIVGGRIAGFSVLVTDATTIDSLEQEDDDARDRVRVVLVDDDDLTRAGLAAQLGSAEDIAVVSEARSIDDALPVVEQVDADVVVVDARLPGIERIEARRRLRADRSTYPRVVALTSSALDALLRDRPARGIGVLPKRAPRDELIEGVRAVARGERVGTPDEPRPWHEPLTEREREVAELVARGFSNLEIARRLYLSVNTVKTHTRHVYDKLGLRGRHELILASNQLPTTSRSSAMGGRCGPGSSRTAT